jgi:hypothetical protein
MVSHKSIALLIDENIVLSCINNWRCKGNLNDTHAGEITMSYILGMYYIQC